MSDFTDGYGLWIDCGELPSDNTWQFFPRPTQSGSLFRLTFLTNWADWNQRKGWRSFGRFRFAHYDDSGVFNLVEPSFPIYLKPEQMFLRLPILPELYNQPYNIRLASFKKYRLFKPGPKLDSITPGINFNQAQASVPDIPWALKVEYLADDASKVQSETDSLKQIKDLIYDIKNNQNQEMIS